MCVRHIKEARRRYAEGPRTYRVPAGSEHDLAAEGTDTNIRLIGERPFDPVGAGEDRDPITAINSGHQTEGDLANLA